MACSPTVLVLRAMREADLDLVERWLGEPHVARWYLDGTTLEEELRDCRDSIAGVQPTHLYLVEDDGRPIGWCQWYRCDDYPEHAEGVGASDGDIGIDYAIGVPDSIGRGRGTEMIAALVDLVRRTHPAAGVIVDPAAANTASRRVLEHNGFELVDVREIPSEPAAGPMAVYRLDGIRTPRRAPDTG